MSLSAINEFIESEYIKSFKFTVNDIAPILWTQLEKVNIEEIEEWKYKDAYLFALKMHENDDKVFKQMGYKESFCLSFLYAIYH
jgi:hypothetical protein